MPDINKDIRFKELFKGINLNDLKFNHEIKVPNEFYQKLLDYFMERSFLNHTGDQRFLDVPSMHGPVTWLQVMRLPIHPDK